MSSSSRTADTQPPPYSAHAWLDLAQARWRAGDEEAGLDAWERGVWLLDGAPRAAALRELDWSLGDVNAGDDPAAVAPLYRRALAVAHQDGEPGQVEALAELLPDLRARRPGLRTRTRWLLLELLRPALGEGSPELTGERAALLARLAGDALDPADRPPPPGYTTPRAALLDLLQAAESLAETAPDPGWRAPGLADLAWLYARLGEHLLALQAAEQAERWWSDAGVQDASLRGSAQARVGAVRQRVSGADAGAADFGDALARLSNSRSPHGAAALLRALDDAYPEGEADADWVERTLAEVDALEPVARLEAVHGALSAVRRFAPQRALDWAQAGLNGSLGLATRRLEILDACGLVSPQAATRWLELAAGTPHGVRGNTWRVLRLAVATADPDAMTIQQLRRSLDAEHDDLGALLLRAARLGTLPPAARDDLVAALDDAWAGGGSPDGVVGASPRLALTHLLPLLPGSPGGEARLREACQRMVDDPGAVPSAAAVAGLTALAEVRDRRAALALLHTLTPKLHVMLGGAHVPAATAALDTLTLLAPGDLPAQLRACASVNARSAANVGRAAAAGGLPEVAAEAFATSWRGGDDPLTLWERSQQALLAAACDLPDRCGLARRALEGFETRIADLAPSHLALLTLLDDVVLPHRGPDALLRERRERAQLRAGIPG